MALPLIPVTVEQLVKIKSALSLDEARHSRNLEVLKDWIKSESHLPNDIDDTYLSNFLALCKDDLTKAKKKFEINIISRKTQQYLSRESFLTSEELDLHDIGRQIIAAPQLTENGNRVVYLAFPKPGKVVNLMKTLKYATGLLDIFMWEDKFAGAIAIVDYSNCTFEYTANADLSLLIKFVRFFVRGLPSRLKSFHIINLSPAGKTIIAALNIALAGKKASKFIVHNTIEELKNYFPDDLLPPEYGGSMQNLDDLSEIWTRYYLENDEWKAKLRKLKLRGDVPNHKLHLDPSYGFGVGGSFRSLQVD